jgi:hypothetical protein
LGTAPVRKGLEEGHGGVRKRRHQDGEWEDDRVAEVEGVDRGRCWRDMRRSEESVRGRWGVSKDLLAVRTPPPHHPKEGAHRVRLQAPSMPSHHRARRVKAAAIQPHTRTMRWHQERTTATRKVTPEARKPGRVQRSLWKFSMLIWRGEGALRCMNRPLGTVEGRVMELVEEC